MPASASSSSTLLTENKGMIDQWTQTENWIPIKDGKESASTENNPSELSQQLITATQAAKHLYHNLYKMTYLSLYAFRCKCADPHACGGTKCLSLSYFETEFLTEHGTHCWLQWLVIEVWGSYCLCCPEPRVTSARNLAFYMEDPNSEHHAGPTDILPTTISPDRFKPVGSTPSRKSNAVKELL